MAECGLTYECKRWSLIVGGNKISKNKERLHLQRADRNEYSKVELNAKFNERQNTGRSSKVQKAY